METVSIDTLREDLKCSWDYSTQKEMDNGDWVFGIDPESSNTLMSIKSKSCKTYSLSSLAFAVMNNHTIAPAKTSDKVIRLSEALKRANEAALSVADMEDSGTCNLDSPIIRLSRWKDYEIKQACELAGVEIGEQLSGWWRGYRFVSTAMQGQASRRTKMAEVAKMHLEADGFDVSMYYQMD